MAKKLIIFFTFIIILVPAMIGYTKRSKEMAARAEERNSSYSEDSDYSRYDD